MSTPLQEHDYIGVSEIPTMENSENKEKNLGLNLKATELRLGLPGSESPERDIGHVVMKGLVSGAKRGFCDTIGDGGSGKWVFSGSGGSEVDLGKNGGFLSPKSVNCGGSEVGIQLFSVDSTSVKEAAPPQLVAEKKPQVSAANGRGSAPAAKAQVVGWPPVRSFRKNSMASNHPKNQDEGDAKLGSGCLYVKVSMDGAPYLRKLDLKLYSSYTELSLALEKMFSFYTIGQCGTHGIASREGLSENQLMDLLHGSEYVLTFEDKDGDWMLVGDVPWDMFIDSCKRLRIVKSSDAVGLAPEQWRSVKIVISVTDA